MYFLVSVYFVATVIRKQSSYFGHNRVSKRNEHAKNPSDLAPQDTQGEIYQTNKTFVSLYEEVVAIVTFRSRDGAERN